MASSNRPARFAGQLLAVDLGLRTGLACFGPDGRLLWYRSHNLGARTRLRRAVHRILVDSGPFSDLIAEGDRDLFGIWAKPAERLGISCSLTQADRWRADLLTPRARERTATAKAAADKIARRVIARSKAKRPSSLRHDAAEAILIGFWWSLRTGRLAGLPDGIV